MTIAETIKNRRAVFPAQYNGKPVSTATITQLLEAAHWAPTHKKTEPWRFKVLQGEALKRLGQFLAKTYTEITPPEKFSDFKHDKLIANPQKAGAIIAICMQRDPKERIPEWEEIAAVAMAVQNMWLQAVDLDLGGYWSSPGLIKYMDRFFDFQEGERCLGFFYLGYTDDALMQGIRSSIQDKTIWMHD